jgi:hypothetical protein
MSDFDLYILKKYLFIPLLVLCIPILGAQLCSASGLSDDSYLSWAMPDLSMTFGSELNPDAGKPTLD